MYRSVTTLVKTMPPLIRSQLGEMAQNATVRTVAETLDAALEELVERCVLMES